MGVEAVVSLLIFGVLFVVMMRYGCGFHLLQHLRGRPRDKAAVARDPVCGMEVPEGTGYAVSCGGATYRFCSRRCLDAFEAHSNSFETAPPPMRVPHA